MKIRIRLLLACLAIAGIARPIDAEIIKSASSPQTSTRAKNLEIILHESTICKRYPCVVKISNDNIALIATRADRRLSDKEIKLLALNMAKLILTNVNKIVEVKVRFYDPASTKYWKDIKLSKAQIQDGLKSGPEQEQILNSINIVNNLGLVDGPNLEARIELYRHILKLRQAGVDVRPYLSKLVRIETAEKNKQNIDTQLSKLNASLTAVELTIKKPISSDINTNKTESSLRQAWQEACDSEASALKAVESAEQEQNDLMQPRPADNDALERYENDDQGLQRKIDKALAAWHEAHRHRDLAYDELKQAKEHY